MLCLQKFVLGNTLNASRIWRCQLVRPAGRVRVLGHTIFKNCEAAITIAVWSGVVSCTYVVYLTDYGAVISDNANSTDTGLKSQTKTNLLIAEHIQTKLAFSALPTKNAGRLIGRWLPCSHNSFEKKIIAHSKFIFDKIRLFFILLGLVEPIDIRRC